MNRPNDLFDLIKSLTRAEKRYFKLRASPQKGEKIYLRLFDAIDRQEVYDDDAIREEFQGENVVRQFHVIKNYLYRLILRTLRSYHENSTIELRIEAHLHDAWVLRSKGLVAQCTRALGRARRLAETHHLDDMLLKVLDLEQQWIPEKVMTQASLIEHHGERRRVFDRLENLDHYRYLAERMSLILLGKGSPRDFDDLSQVEDLIDHPLLSSEEHALSLSARSYYYHLHSSYHFIQRNVPKALEFLERERELLEAQEEYIAAYANSYVTVLINMATVLAPFDESDRFNEAISRMRLVPELLKRHGVSNDRLCYRVLYVSYGIEISRMVELGEFRQAAERLLVLDEKLVRLRQYMSPSDLLRFWFMKAYVHIGTEQYEQALEWINRILAAGEAVWRRQVYDSARIVNLIVHYELGNRDYLEHLVRSTYRYLRGKGSLHRCEESLLRHFRTLSGIRDRPQLIEWLFSLKEELAYLSDDPMEQTAFRYFDYLSWLESKIQGKGFAEVKKTSATARMTKLT